MDTTKEKGEKEVSLLIIYTCQQCKYYGPTWMRCAKTDTDHLKPIEMPDNCPLPKVNDILISDTGGLK